MPAGDDVDAGIVQVQFDGQLGMGGQEGGQQRRDMLAAEIQGRCQTDEAGGGDGGFAQPILHLLPGLHQRLRFRQRVAAKARQRQPPRGAVEERSAKPRFQPGDGAGYGGDGEVARAGGARKRAGFRDGDEEIPGLEIGNAQFTNFLQ